MALIPCPACGEQVSAAAVACLKCGHPIAAGVAPPVIRAKPESTMLERVGCVYPAIAIIVVLLLVLLFK